MSSRDDTSTWKCVKASCMSLVVSNGYVIPYDAGALQSSKWNVWVIQSNYLGFASGPVRLSSREDGFSAGGCCRLIVACRPGSFFPAAAGFRPNFAAAAAPNLETMPPVPDLAPAVPVPDLALLLPPPPACAEACLSAANDIFPAGALGAALLAALNLEAAGGCASEVFLAVLGAAAAIREARVGLPVGGGTAAGGLTGGGTLVVATAGEPRLSWGSVGAAALRWTGSSSVLTLTLHRHKCSRHQQHK